MSKFRQYDDTSVLAILENIKLIYIIVNMCDYVTCANGGSCGQANNSQCFTCACPMGFTGSVCQTKDDLYDPSKTF